MIAGHSFKAWWLAISTCVSAAVAFPVVFSICLFLTVCVWWYEAKTRVGR